MNPLADPELAKKTEPMLVPYTTEGEQPFGPSNGRVRTGLALRPTRGRASLDRHQCRDHGRRAQVTTWPRLPMVPPRFRRR